MKIAVVGSRAWPLSRYRLIAGTVDGLPDDSEVVSGHALGADQFAESCALRRGLKVTVFRADWHRFGHSAGFRRNIDIVNYADKIIAFSHNASKGTAHSVRLAKKAGKPLEIFYSDGRYECFNLAKNETADA